MNTKIIAFGLVIALVLSAGMASALSNSGGGDWKYYKEITIKENSGTALSDYQVLVELNPSNFPDKAKPDGSDVRFAENGKELNYWIEDYDAGAKTARIWVKVPSIPANGEAKIKVYYGNEKAGSVSDGDATLEFFDDFDGSKLDTSKWDITGAPSISSGSCQIDATEGIRTKAPLGANKDLLIEFKKQITGKYTFRSFFKEPTSSNFRPSSTDKIFACVDDNSKWRWYLSEGCQHYDPKETSWDGSWHTFNLIWSSSIVKGHDLYLSSTPRFSVMLSDMTWGYWPESHPWRCTGTVDYFKGFKIEFYSGNPADSTSYLDYIHVRKYTSPEPTLTLSAEYPVVHTALTLTKTASPHSIKQGQKTTVKITVENTGTTTIKDIEVVDTPSADFDFVSGETSGKYGSLKSGESRTLQYTIESRDTGKFDLDQATATYADEEGNYQTVKSDSPMVEVLSPLEKPEIPTDEEGEKNGMSGFEVVFAITGVLAVVYLFRRKNERKKI